MLATVEFYIMEPGGPSWKSHPKNPRLSETTRLAGDTPVIFRSRYQRIIKVDVSRELDW
jgi:hypothetical protein